VAIGISLALITTVAGLLIAMFTQPFYNYYMTQVSGFVQQIQTATNFLFETFEEVRAFAKGERAASPGARG
jgi:biopolymer transport protein ExbB/TolQ